MDELALVMRALSTHLRSLSQSATYEPRGSA